MYGFVRLSVAVPAGGVTDFTANRSNTLALWQQAHEQGSALVIFPELGLSSYTARDLLANQHLLEACQRSLDDLLRESRNLHPMAVVGLPLRVGSSLFNVAAALQGGQVLGIIPKSYLPNYREFEETRWFSFGTEVKPGSVIELFGQQVPFGTDILFAAKNISDLVVGIEICEDYWVQVPPSSYQVSAGATVVGNLSASNFLVGKSELRRMLARSSSDRGKCAYLYVGAGPDESSTDLAFDADAFIFENGRELAASRRFWRENQLVTADVDLELLIHERLVTNSFNDCAHQHYQVFRRIPFSIRGKPSGPLRRQVSPHPFLPHDPQTLAIRCWEIFEIQTQALATRLKTTKSATLILGLSGGLDSTQAALVGIGALDLLRRPHTDLHCILLPGLGTSWETRTNATKLAQALGATCREISISEATRLILSAVEHSTMQSNCSSVEELMAILRSKPELGDTVVENVQARLRTLILMTLANQHHGLVVGTGDLSEKALGWSTYAGDQIAMYDVNAGVPKTLIQFVIRWVANERVSSWAAAEPAILRSVLFAILDTPISPELLPPDTEGKIAQLTEAAIGPFELHDFYLYYLVRHGARPGRILDLAQVAFAGRYDLPILKKWLLIFLERFFNNQFKRSCTADGPKVGMVALSPRGDWRMPSDAQVASWKYEVESYPE